MKKMEKIELKEAVMPTTEEALLLMERLKQELIQSALETIKQGGGNSGILFWKDDWWIGINLPEEYPEMVVEVVKFAARKRAMENLITSYNFSIRDDTDPYKGTKKLFLVKNIV